jgi:16S rRNA (cytosine1402-N4)-methyltransferase
LTEREVIHQPVLASTLMRMLEYPSEAVVVDATVGQAGHAIACAGRLSSEGTIIGLDVDPESLAVAGIRLKDVSCKVHLVRENFGRLDEVISALGMEQVEVIMADLGVSSAQLADAKKGLSFQSEGPLDMRLDDRLEEKVGDLVNRWPAERLAEVIWRYGEERHSRRIARAIVAARKEKPLESTQELVAVINRALGIRGKGHKSKIHPATRTFQGLRIYVNDELGNLERLLEMGPRLLKGGGQIAIMSYHSLEDRLVKHNFRDNKKLGYYEIQTKKPLQADEEERQENPRSRSAKLRVARRM